MNDDMISRKAAIDEVKRLHDVAWANWKETRISANAMIDALKDLPSAETKTCDGCKHKGKWEDELYYGISCPCINCKRRVNDNYE